jgi:hypothetical protein
VGARSSRGIVWATVLKNIHLGTRRTDDTMSERHWYHERQSRLRCAQHAINNLVQRPAVSSFAMDAIAVEMGGAFSLEHRWPLLGNFDANVLLSALQLCMPPLEAEWWDARRTQDADLRELVSTRCREKGVVGLIVNVSTSSWWTMHLFPSRHWYALRLLDEAGSWLHLDSKSAEPKVLQDDMVHGMLRQDLCEQSAQVLLIREIETHAETQRGALAQKGTHT